MFFRREPLSKIDFYLLALSVEQGKHLFFFLWLFALGSLRLLSNSLARSCVLSHSVVSHSFLTHGHSPPGSCNHGISQQEYCDGVPFPPSGDLPDPETEPRSPALQANSLPSEPPGKYKVSQTERKYCAMSCIGGTEVLII